MKFLTLENALREIVRDGKNLYGIASALEHILKDDNLSAEDKAEKLAELIREWDSSADNA